VFPPEPPVAITIRPERRGDVKGAPQFGAAERTLDVEHRSGIHHTFDGRRSGNTFPLVSSEPRRGKNGDSKGERNRRFRSPCWSLDILLGGGRKTQGLPTRLDAERF
jgi:hypothetical protein